MEVAAEKLTKEQNLQIIAAIENDDRAALDALLKEHGINSYLMRTWEEEVFFEPTFYECSGNALNLAVHFKNEALAVDLLQRGAEVQGTYGSAESALGWSESTTSLFETALARRMPELARRLMSRPEGVDWGVENRHDCDAWAAGQWSESLFAKVMAKPDRRQFIAEVGFFAGSLQGQQVNVSAEGNQFRVQIGGQDYGMRATMTDALELVRETLTPAPSESAGMEPEGAATCSSTMPDEIPF